eukprot:CAMPEP_0197303032 /NCGR_PEP_ID=MMETSP0890-20130614/51420_1 /TAXON_ID=44058 ORGANISM="Aureoumbra lagunensis, Strain CCMP1510" /NCGR_SAMPLE_ID=MMETSP0890 /ASSEMBLY_ACC=CAM_ASM_000533 /LENGTH=111 /DNA_ID=CAMNT_0042782781 /DNA_START=1496 /DNA_END=1831 /DNA_ORIENTATION=-
MNPMLLVLLTVLILIILVLLKLLSVLALRPLRVLGSLLLPDISIDSVVIMVLLNRLIITPMVNLTPRVLLNLLVLAMHENGVSVGQLIMVVLYAVVAERESSEKHISRQKE